MLAEISKANRPDEQIDTSEMPEIRDFNGAQRGRFYRPVKRPISIRLDTDVITWFRAHGVPYQRLINSVLRSYMESHA